jgi:hypothetical protein
MKIFCQAECLPAATFALVHVYILMILLNLCISTYKYLYDAFVFCAYTGKKGVYVWVCVRVFLQKVCAQHTKTVLS